MKINNKIFIFGGCKDPNMYALKFEDILENSENVEKTDTFFPNEDLIFDSTVEEIEYFKKKKN